MNFPALLDRLLDGHYLTGAESQSIMDDILDGDVGPERLAAFVTALRAKSPHEDELVGFARSMRAHAVTVTPPAGIVLDNCGTGGAAYKAFNVSTTTAFLLAGAGITVAKHGNRSVTRPSGSADILEAAGSRLDLPAGQAEAVLREFGIAFLFAPNHHPAMRHAGPVRQALGIKTVFNLLGPLCNPAGATHQVLGVYDAAYVPVLARVLARLGCQGGYVIHGLPGFDEATPCGDLLVCRILDGEAGDVETLDPAALGALPCEPEDIAAVPADQAPALMARILSGQERGPRRHTVALNAAFGLHAAGKVATLKEGYDQARALLDEGVGKAKLDAYLEATQ